MKNFLIVGNWKLNKGPSQAAHFIEQFHKKTQNDVKGVEFVIFPPAMALERFSHEGNKHLHFGLQNFHWEESGAFTGENSLETLKEIGGRYSLVGHSERRAIFGETLSTVEKKMTATFRQGVMPILCIGETLTERDEDRVFDVLKGQLVSALSHWNGKDRFHIAYEPVWAIGTGRVASPEQVAQVHSWVRAFLNETWGAEGCQNIRILYGGSVKPNNAGSLSRVPEVGGFLIGGASLEANSFWEIYQAVQT